MDQHLIAALKAHFNSDFICLTPVHGGDINHAFTFQLNGQSIFLKANYTDHAFQLFQTEFNALKYFEEKAEVLVPKVNNPVLFEGGSFLPMEYIDSIDNSESSWISLATSLAKLHQIRSDKFGWQEDNFIGTLPQINSHHSKWS